MKKSLGAILLAVGAVLSLLGILLPIGKVSFWGISDSMGNLISNKAVPVLFYISIVVAIAATVMGFMKQTQIAGIVGAVAGILMIITTFTNTAKGVGDKVLSKEYGDLGETGDLLSYSNGIGWFCFLLGSIVLIGGAVICFIGKDDNGVAMSAAGQYQDPNQQ